MAKLVLMLLILSGCGSHVFRTGGEVDPPLGCHQGRSRGVDCWNVSDLKAIHKNISKRFNYTPDNIAHGVGDYWRNPEQLTGQINDDCEDFSLAARIIARLFKIPSRLVFSSVDNQAHISLSIGEWILDNRHDGIVKKELLNYRWIAISGFAAGDPWLMIKN